MIRIDALWLATTPIDMRMGTERLLARVVGEQSRQIESQAQAIGFRDAKIASITFELRRLKARQFAARIERMNAEQRQLFEETMAADQADLEAQLAALKAASRCRAMLQTPTPLASPNAKPCPSTSNGLTTTMSQRTRPVTAARRWCVSAKT